MLVQYLYALGTMVPCPLWFWYRWLSAGFLTAVFVWSIYNGATYYIDVFGKRFQNELEQLKKDVAKWQPSPEMALSPETTPKTTARSGIGEGEVEGGCAMPLVQRVLEEGVEEEKRRESIDGIPLLDSRLEATAVPPDSASRVRLRPSRSREGIL